MAGKKAEVVKATTVSIRATSRASIKVRDNFYTVEYCEERSVPADCNIEYERSVLWDVCNAEVDNQIQDIIDMTRKEK